MATSHEHTKIGSLVLITVTVIIGIMTLLASLIFNNQNKALNSEAGFRCIATGSFGTNRCCDPRARKAAFNRCVINFKNPTKPPPYR